MKKSIIATVVSVHTLLSTSANTYASIIHTVASGESMWKIAVKYQVGLSEIVNANPNISDPELIYPGQIINIPTIDTSVTDYENEVVRLVNQERVKNGLSALTQDWELSRVA